MCTGAASTHDGRYHYQAEEANHGFSKDARAAVGSRRADDVLTPFIYPDLDSAVRTQLSSGPARMAIDHAGEPSTRQALAAAFADSRQPDGSYRQDNSFRYLIARA
jgi:hypothetical protein